MWSRPGKNARHIQAFYLCRQRGIMFHRIGLSSSGGGACRPIGVEAGLSPGLIITFTAVSPEGVLRPFLCEGVRTQSSPLPCKATVCSCYSLLSYPEDRSMETTQACSSGWSQAQGLRHPLTRMASLEGMKDKLRPLLPSGFSATVSSQHLALLVRVLA